MDESLRESYEALPKSFKGSQFAGGMILGSGWSDAMKRFDVVERLSFGAIPGLNASTVAGHAGEVIIVEKAGRKFIVFCGRRHWYEGEGWLPIVTPLELMRRLGVERVLLTNAVGGIRDNLAPGDFLLIEDHINLQGINPLQGAVREGWGIRFPDQSEVYNREFGKDIATAAGEVGVELHRGVYAFTAGPCFETPAEVRAYAALGASVVGMSTVPEATLANAMGLEVAALSCITNMAAGMGEGRLTHHEVLRTTAKTTPKMYDLLNAVAQRMAER